MNLIGRFRHIIIPAGIAVSFPLMLYSHNLGQLLITDVLPTLIMTALFGGTTGLMVHIIYKHRGNTIVYSTLVLLIFFTYADILSFAGQWKIFRIVSPLSPSFQIFLIEIFLICLLFFVFRTKKIHIALQDMCAGLSLFLVLIPSASILRYTIETGFYRQQSPLKLPRTDISSIQEKPDIYYIVPDKHTAGWLMKERFGYDMTPFLTYLQTNGFQVLEKSTSNYPKTFLSLASSLNMEYLDYLSPRVESRDETAVYPLIESNNVLAILKNLGYSYYQLGSWYKGTAFNRNADKNFILENDYLVSLNGYTYAVVSMTMLRPFIDTHLSTVFLGDSSSDKLNRILYQFEKINDVVRIQGPKFVFLHIIAPHPPWVLDRFCTATDPGYSKTRGEEKNYAEQAECIDMKLMEMVDTIMKTSSRSSVIIIQSDEGIDFSDGNDRWGEVSDAVLQEKFPILTAVFLPGIGHTTLSDTATPVNIFRYILREVFSFELAPVDDRNFIYQGKNAYYAFTDVTDKISVRLSKVSGILKK